MLRRPPTPPRPDTLSPYTTVLFRSSGGVFGPFGRALRNSGPAFDSARAVSAGNATAGVLFGPFGAAVYGADRLQQPAHPQTHRADVRMGQDHRRHRQSHRRLHLPDDHLQLRLIAQDHPGNRMMTKRSATMTRRSEEHTSELQSLMRISYAVFCLKTQKQTHNKQHASSHTT